jgi:hypothetical protein
MNAGTGAISADAKAIAEIQFLFGMSEKNPLKHFLSSDEHATRLAFRMPDLNADETANVIASVQADLRQAFPISEIEVGGLAAVVPKVNKELSQKLMWGFFDAMLDCAPVGHSFSFAWMVTGRGPS